MAGNIEPQQWCFSQVKGTVEEDIADADIISCVEFDHDGEYLATGDKGGRVVIFERDYCAKGSQGQKSAEYSVYATFQSHEPEFDYLKSLEIEEKINKIKFLKGVKGAKFVLTTNDKTIKLWKIAERCKLPCGYNTLESDRATKRDPSSITSVTIPTYRKPPARLVFSSCRKVYPNAHTYHINSVSVNSDEETYLSADDLRINLWNIETTNQSFNIVDIKPANMEELTEVITAAEFHPSECNVFVYSTSKGSLRLCDMRSQALCDRHVRNYEEPEDPNFKSFFSEIISSISDFRFSHDGRYMLTRDYLMLKVWDMNMESRPVESYPVHEYLKGKLCTLYENDSIFDKFECAWSGNDRQLLTGSYNNFFRIIDRDCQQDLTLEATRESVKPKQVLKPRKVFSGPGKRKKDEISVDSFDYNKKILHATWHPKDDIIAIAATNNLYLFNGKD